MIQGRLGNGRVTTLGQLQQGIGLQAYGQRNPLNEYKMMGYDMFNDMEAAISEDTVKALMHVRIEQKVEREELEKIAERVRALGIECSAV